jgi:hypothetical protein
VFAEPKNCEDAAKACQSFPDGTLLVKVPWEAGLYTDPRFHASATLAPTGVYLKGTW